VAYAGSHRAIVVGFPFETITDGDERNRMMAKSLDYLLSKHKSAEERKSERERRKQNRRAKK
jgi:hypothetical protein